MGMTVAVTGPTGEIGLSTVDALERDPEVDAVLGMARRPFDPQTHGWTKTAYRQGDITDRDAVDALVAEADVVVHLAFIIMGSRTESHRINLAGTRNVFEATVAATRPTRLVYTSSVAAYGYHRHNPSPLTEDVPAAGSPEHYYSEQKAECEALLHEVTDDTDLAVYVLRPCVVAGPRAPAFLDAMPWNRFGPRVTGAVRAVSPRRTAAPAARTRPGHATSAGPPRRRRQRDCSRGSRARDTGRLQPRRRRADRVARPGSRRRRSRGAGAAGYRTAGFRGAGPATARAGCRGVGARRPSRRPAGHHEGEAGTGLAAEIHQRADPAGDGRGPPRVLTTVLRRRPPRRFDPARRRRR